MNQSASRNEVANSESTRHRILHVATELFAAKGFGQVSIRDISAQAGVSVSTVMYHGGSKKQLLEACLDAAFSRESALGDWLQQLNPDAVVDQAGFFEVYDRFIEVAIAQSVEFPKVRRLWWRLLLDHPEAFRNLEGKHVREIYRKSLRFLNACRKAGWIRGNSEQLNIFLSSLDWILDGFFVGGLIESEGKRSTPGDPQQLSALEDWLKNYGRKLLS